MYLKRLELLNYKNISQLELDFSKGINCFIGNNGVGKTNILDSIFYLSSCKSYFSLPDSQNIKHEEKYMMLKGSFEKQGSREEIYCGIKQGQKKKFKRNNEEYKKFSEHIGLLPVVMVSPSDNVLIDGSGEDRRRFMDGVISLWDKEYLNNLIKYNRAVQQRNKMLKDGSFSRDVFEVWDEQLVMLGESIHKKRKAFVEEIIPVFQKYYELISSGKEKVKLNYKSQLNGADFGELLVEHYNKDRAFQYTTCGVHRDDIVFSLGDFPVKKIGSQGQKKTYLIALKLAQFEFIKSKSNVRPILLLDDIFDKLDAERVEQIVCLVSDHNFGQIFISDTNRDHLDSILKENVEDYNIFKINNGVLCDEKE